MGKRTWLVHNNNNNDKITSMVPRSLETKLQGALKQKGSICQSKSFTMELLPCLYLSRGHIVFAVYFEVSANMMHIYLILCEHIFW